MENMLKTIIEFMIVISLCVVVFGVYIRKKYKDSRGLYWIIMGGSLLFFCIYCAQKK